MEIKQATFLVSNTNVEKCPKQQFPEYAFIGRSNVGKSSLINMLTNHKGLAKTSAKPGKTQLINHFLINNSWFLVDLPGYGYAQVSKSVKKVFQKFAVYKKYTTFAPAMNSYLTIKKCFEQQHYEQKVFFLIPYFCIKQFFVFRTRPKFPS